jgi:hypothetical protein
VKLTGVAVFTAGYVIGAKAGRERYAQIIHRVARASQALDEFSARRPPGRRGHDSRPVGGDPQSQAPAL